jgi:hypothetical protein
VFVVFLIVGLVLIADFPDADAPDQEITDYLSDSDVHTRNIIGFYLWTVAGVAFLWFLSHLRGVLRRAEGEPGTLSTLGFAGGVLFTATLLVSGAAMAAVPGGIELGEASKPDPDFVRFFPQMGYGVFLIGGAFSAIALVLTTSILTLRTNVLPAWTAWLGFVASLALIFAAVFLPMIALPIWVLAVSIVFLMRRPASTG